MMNDKLAQAHEWVNRMYSAAVADELGLVSSVVIPTGERAAVLTWMIRIEDRVTAAPLGMMPLELEGVFEEGAGLSDSGIEMFGHVLEILRNINQYKPGIGETMDGRSALVIQMEGQEPRVLVVLPWHENPFECWADPADGAGETRH